MTIKRAIHKISVIHNNTFHVRKYCLENTVANFRKMFHINNTLISQRLRYFSVRRINSLANLSDLEG